MERLRKGDTRPYDWAVEFDAWTKEKIAGRDFKALLNYEQAGESANSTMPTPITISQCSTPSDWLAKGGDRAGLRRSDVGWHQHADVSGGIILLFLPPEFAGVCPVFFLKSREK